MTAFPNINIAVVGCGRMATALVRGAYDAGALGDVGIFCIDVDEEAAAALAAPLGAEVGPPLGGQTTAWLVAVKPHDVAAVLASLPIADGDIVISVAAGITIDTLRASVGADASVVRSMPNTPALVGAGVTAVMAATPADARVAAALFGAVGDVVFIDDEKHFDAVTAVSGSGPAFVFVAIEALADGGVAMGLPRQLALQLAIETVRGAATLAGVEDAHPAELKDRVASPGGTTIAGLAELEKAGFRAALIGAVRAAAARSKELGG